MGEFPFEATTVGVGSATFTESPKPVNKTRTRRTQWFTTKNRARRDEVCEAAAILRQAYVVETTKTDAGDEYRITVYPDGKPAPVETEPLPLIDIEAEVQKRTKELQSERDSYRRDMESIADLYNAEVARRQRAEAERDRAIAQNQSIQRYLEESERSTIKKFLNRLGLDSITRIDLGVGATALQVAYSGGGISVIPIPSAPYKPNIASAAYRCEYGR